VNTSFIHHPNTVFIHLEILMLHANTPFHQVNISVSHLVNTSVSHLVNTSVIHLANTMFSHLANAMLPTNHVNATFPTLRKSTTFPTLRKSTIPVDNTKNVSRHRTTTKTRSTR